MNGENAEWRMLGKNVLLKPGLLRDGLAFRKHLLAEGYSARDALMGMGVYAERYGHEYEDVILDGPDKNPAA